jgi:nitrogen fixation protein NifU and related proteins
MMQDLYRQVIMDHYKYPRNKGLLEGLNRINVHLNNPSCGDEMTVQVLIENDQIKDFRHEGSGCSICCSSASVLSSHIIGKSLDEGKDIILNFYELIKGLPYNKDILSMEMQAYQGVSLFPARIKCATLGYKALEKIIVT